jgi:PPOX class probable F420-dependent enzyme
MIMPKGDVPVAFHDLLESRAFAFVSTLGKRGEPQVNPVWYLWDGAHIKISLMDGKQKYLNLQRDGRIAIAFAHPSNPYRYLEVRGRVTSIDPDVDDAVFGAISTKYTGSPFSLEGEGIRRYVATVTVERHTFQEPVDIPEPEK